MVYMFLTVPNEKNARAMICFIFAFLKGARFLCEQTHVKII